MGVGLFNNSLNAIYGGHDVKDKKWKMIIRL